MLNIKKSLPIQEPSFSALVSQKFYSKSFTTEQAKINKISNIVVFCLNENFKTQSKQYGAEHAVHVPTIFPKYRGICNCKSRSKRLSLLRSHDLQYMTLICSRPGILRLTELSSFLEASSLMPEPRREHLQSKLLHSFVPEYHN